MTSTDQVDQLHERHQRLMSSVRLKTMLALFMSLLLLGMTAIMFALVTRIFHRLRPRILDDLVWKVRTGARALAQSADYGIVLNDPRVVEESFGEYGEDADMVAIVVLDLRDHPLVVRGQTPDGIAALFAGPANRVHRGSTYLSSWNLAKIEGASVGKVAFAVSTRRLGESERLRRTILASAGGACVIALIISLFFTTFYLAPLVKLTEDAITNLKRLNTTLETRVQERTAELRETNVKLQGTVGEIEKMQDQLVKASRQTGMADVATTVLHNVGNVLNSLNVSASLIGDHIEKSKANRLPMVAQLLVEHQDDLGRFLSTDPRGQKLPEYLSRLAEVVVSDRKAAVAEVESLRKNVEHIKAIIHMQQSLAKSGGMVEALDLHELLEDAIRFNQASAQKHHIELVREYCELPQAHLDRHKLFQVVMNLLSNAKHAVSSSGFDHQRIVVRTRLRDDASLLLEVEDNGCGIAPANIDKIFNLGFTTKRDGHGFGLHSSACAIREMNGTLVVRSDGVGKGAVFTVILPVDGRAEQGVGHSESDGSREATIV